MKRVENSVAIALQRIGEYAVRALLYEVSASPKPGLVDRFNSGAHRDMNFFTFMASAAAIAPYFHQCAQTGAAGVNHDLKALFGKLRGLGILCEQNMFAATGNVNTHKGLVFSLGILAGAAGYLTAQADGRLPTVPALCQAVADMTQGLVARDFSRQERLKDGTHGERLFVKYGITGIRGEVESGFQTVRSVALPVLDRWALDGSCSLNDILVQVLLHLMASTEDTNIIARHDLTTLQYVRQYAQAILKLGGMFSSEGQKALARMDREFIKRNISPGGSADLLAVAVMLWSLGSELRGGAASKPEWVNRF